MALVVGILAPQMAALRRCPIDQIQRPVRGATLPSVAANGRIQHGRQFDTEGGGCSTPATEMCCRLEQAVTDD